MSYFQKLNNLNSAINLANSSVLLDAGDNPTVACSDESVLKPASWNGDGWDVETVTGGGDDPLGNRSPWRRTLKACCISPWQMCVTNRTHPSQVPKGVLKDPGVAVAKLLSYPCRDRRSKSQFDGGRFRVIPAARLART